LPDGSWAYAFGADAQKLQREDKILDTLEKWLRPLHINSLAETAGGGIRTFLESLTNNKIPLWVWIAGAILLIVVLIK
jgi:hypothetical protein